MKKLHKYHNGSGLNIIGTKKGQRTRYLCSNNAEPRCPSLGFDPNASFVTEDIALEYLADILVDIYLSQKNK